MKHFDDLTEMWRNMLEYREKLKQEEYRKHQEELTKNIRDNKERKDDGRLPTVG